MILYFILQFHCYIYYDLLKSRLIILNLIIDLILLKTINKKILYNIIIKNSD